MKVFSLFVKYVMKDSQRFLAGGMTMKRFAASLLTILLCIMCVSSLASIVQIPEELKVILDEQNRGDHVLDYIEFITPDGVRYAFILDPWRLREYQYRDGIWQSARDTGALYNGKVLRFQRHGTQSPRADGSAYPDDLGFDVFGEIDGICESYHYDGEQFSLCGWVDASKYHGAVLIDGTTISYYPFGSTEAEYAIDVGEALYGWTGQYEDHPATPEEAKERAALLKCEMEDDFPGYTLLDYAVYNSGTNAEAGYYRIKDGMLDIKQVTYEAGIGCVREDDAMAVPLTDEMLKKLETEAPEILIRAGGFDSTFASGDAIDLSVIPVAGEIIASDVQPGGMILLTEDEEKKRHLHWVIQDGKGGYEIQTTNTLPENVSLDLFHAGNDEVSFTWKQNDRYRRAGYKLGEDGSWNLEWVMTGLDYQAVFWGVRVYSSEVTDGNPIKVGTLKEFDLFEADLKNLPYTEEELMDALDRDGWAVVHNPNPKDRLHLRTAPKKGAQSLGKFYNGTPMRVLENLGEWCHVCIGLDEHLEGYMMTKYLTFGKQMDDVKWAFPQKSLLEENSYRSVYVDMNLSEDGNTIHEGSYWIVGVVEDDLYIILTETGETGYAPQDWFWEGNG